MKKHVKIYLKHFNYSVADFVPCEVCESKATDIHHIDARGMGGRASADVISNLMALCRSCHEAHGDIKELKDSLRHIHTLRLANI
jgi:hypothetical protein